ncbi:MAG: sugar ABC transporter substrate-binding protein [Burkholderiales bacterium]
MQPVLAVFTKNRSNPAYAAARLGADRAAARCDAVTKHYVPAKPDDVDEQIALIDQALADKPDAFVLVPVHPTAVNEALRRIYASSIPLVGCLNRFSEAGPVCYVGADDYAIGVGIATYLYRHLGGRGDVVVMEGVPSSVTSNERVRGFQDALRDFPQVRIVRKIRGDYLREPARLAAGELLRSGERFDAVLAANDDMAIGMIAALEAAGRQSIVVGVNAIPEAITAIKRGKLLATADFNAKDIATIAAEAALRHLRGESVPSEIILAVQIVDGANYAEWDKPFEARPDIDWHAALRT